MSMCMTNILIINYMTLSKRIQYEVIDWLQWKVNGKVNKAYGLGFVGYIMT